MQHTVTLVFRAARNRRGEVVRQPWARTQAYQGRRTYRAEGEKEDQSKACSLPAVARKRQIDWKKEVRLCVGPRAREVIGLVLHRSLVEEHAGGAITYEGDHSAV